MHPINQYIFIRLLIQKLYQIKFIKILFCIIYHFFFPYHFIFIVSLILVFCNFSNKIFEILSIFFLNIFLRLLILVFCLIFDNIYFLSSYKQKKVNEYSLYY